MGTRRLPLLNRITGKIPDEFIPDLSGLYLGVTAGEHAYPSGRRVRFVDDSTGSDSNSGRSPGLPFKTLQAAHDALGVDGGQIIVYDGTYTSPLAITNSGVKLRSWSGSRKAALTVSSLSASAISVSGVDSAHPTVQTRIEGFTLSGPGKTSGGTGAGLSLNHLALGFSADDLLVTGFGSHGIAATDSYTMEFGKGVVLTANGGDGFNGQTNINNVLIAGVATLNGGAGWKVIGGTSVVFASADAESNANAGIDLRYVSGAVLVGVELEVNGTDGSSPNVYLHYRSGLGEKTISAVLLGGHIRGGTTTQRGLVIDGASGTRYMGVRFDNHVVDHVQTTSNADRTSPLPCYYTGTGTVLTDGSASTSRMDYDATNLCMQTDVLRWVPRSTNPAALAQGQVWYSSTADQAKMRDASRIRNIHSGLNVTATLDFPSVAATGGTQDLTVTVTGAVTADEVVLGPPNNLNAGLVPYGFVSAADTVTVRVTNVTAGAIDPPSGGWGVAVIKK